MAMKLIYQMLAKLPIWMVLHARSDTTKEIEILILRHQLAVLQRRRPRPPISWSDRAVLAALARLLPARRRRGFLVAPAAILRWHRHLVRRRWTTQSVRAGRPGIPAGVPPGPHQPAAPPRDGRRRRATRCQAQPDHPVLWLVLQRTRGVDWLGERS